MSEKKTQILPFLSHEKRESESSTTCHLTLLSHLDKRIAWMIPVTRPSRLFFDKLPDWRFWKDADCPSLPLFHPLRSPDYRKEKHSDSQVMTAAEDSLDELLSYLHIGFIP
jgi:hypothetical protein